MRLVLASLVAFATADNAAASHNDGHTDAGALPHSHTHADKEIDEVQPPVLFELTYTSEVMGNISGGISRGAEYLDNLDMVLEVDMERIAGIGGTKLHVYGLYNNGASISARVGDSFATSNIEADSRHQFRLYEAWLETALTPSLSVKAGLYDLNSEFDTLETSGLFVGSAHGIGVDISQTGLNGPSIFPVTSLAVRVEKEFSSAARLRAAVLDGVPGNPDRPGRTSVKFGANEGVLAIAEFEWSPREAKLLAGHWRYTARFDNFDGGRARGNAGYYVRGETKIWERHETRLDIFARVGTARARFNMFDRFMSAGIKATGIVGSNADEAGIAIATARTSRRYRNSITAADDHETALEMTYRREILPFLTVQPSLQFVFNPSADPTLKTAVVPGIRTELSFRF